MALRVNVSQASGVPDDTIRAIVDLNLQYPEKWQGGWVTSLIASQENDDLEQKLTSEDGVSRCHILSGAAVQHDSKSVCASLLALRDAWK